MAESMMNSAPASETSNTTHSLNTNKIIPIDFKSVLQIPDSHSWSLSEDPPLVGLVPIIDLGDPTADLEGHIRDACEKWGAFQVINHGVSTNLLKKIEDQARRLFELPFEQKIRAARTEDGLGGYGMARIAPFFSKMMWSEGFTVAGSPEEHARQLWPHDYNTFCNVVEDYQKEMKVLADRILGMLLGSLGLKTEDVNWLCPNSGSKHPLRSILQLNSYPVCPDPSQTMGLAPHTDSLMLSLLYQSNVSGLQVHCGKTGRWVTVPPLTDGLVINLGDLMNILSNGKFKSALHRAIVNKAQHRISVACFLSPPFNVKISPLIKLTDPDHPALYRSITWKEYLDVKATYFDKSLDVIRL